MALKNLTKETFLQKISDYESNHMEWKYLGDKPAIIDFYADWCGPCRALTPVLEELASEYENKINIYKIDTQRESELSAVFGIKSIPSILFIPMDGQPQMMIGAQPKDQIRKIIETILLGNKSNS